MPNEPSLRSRVRRWLGIDFADQARREIEQEEANAGPCYMTRKEHNRLLARAGIPPRQETFTTP